MAFSIYYYDKSGRRYEGRSRICSDCGKQEIVRATNNCKRCQTCARPKPNSDVNYLDSTGKKYPGWIRTCVQCGKREIKRISNKSLYCRRCSQMHKKSGIRPEELFVPTKRGKERTRAKKEKCSQCGQERIVRGDAKNKTTLCRKCSCIEKGKIFGKIYGPLSRIDGRSSYRRNAFKYFSEKCCICDSVELIEIHHIDANRKNNIITNLMPLCNSCHKSVHWQIRKGLTCDEAIQEIKKKKTTNNIYYQQNEAPVVMAGASLNPNNN